jgi:hypothetical protein
VNSKSQGQSCKWLSKRRIYDIRDSWPFWDVCPSCLGTSPASSKCRISKPRLFNFTAAGLFLGTPSNEVCLMRFAFEKDREIRKAQVWLERQSLH